MSDFEIEKKQPQPIEIRHLEVTPKEAMPQQKTQGQIWSEAGAQNLGKILDIASTILQMKATSNQTKQDIERIEANRKLLWEEANAYARKKQETTKQLCVIRDTVNDFYQFCMRTPQTLSGDQIVAMVKILTETLDKIKE